MTRFAVIVAGGTGSRLGGPVPKQFLLLAGKPVLYYALEAFYRFDPEIRPVVVLPSDQFPAWIRLTGIHDMSLPHTVIAGGESWFHSVQNGLHALTGSGIVAIHDGVRPLISPDLIASLFREASQYGNALPVIPVNESLREAEPPVSHPVDRQRYRVVQTPQLFDLEKIRRAYQQPYQPSFTDDATVWEASGEQIHLAAGDPANLKITLATDLIVAECLLKAEKRNG